MVSSDAFVIVEREFEEVVGSGAGAMCGTTRGEVRNERHERHAKRDRRKAKVARWALRKGALGTAKGCPRHGERVPSARQEHDGNGFRHGIGLLAIGR